MIFLKIVINIVGDYYLSKADKEKRSEIFLFKKYIPVWLILVRFCKGDNLLGDFNCFQFAHGLDT